MISMDVDEKGVEQPTQRKFGYAKVLWEIENCFCETHKNKWEIPSPKFSINGFLPIKWRFILKASKIDEIYIASIYLERSESDNISCAVRVSWNLTCSFGRENITLCEKEDVFDEKGCISSRIKDFKKFQERLQLISTKKLNVEANFLVTSTEDGAAFERSNDIGLRTLSQELGILYNLKDYNDLAVNIGKESLEGHKAILTTGNKLIKDVVHHNSGRKDIYLGWSNDKSAGKIFSYLYTGNLDYVLRTPSILIDQAINYFNVKELEKYYLKDEVVLRTKSEVREFYYQWIVTDISSIKENSLFSPHFGDRNLNITFRLRIEPGESGVTTGYPSIFLEASSLREFQELYVIFDIIDIFGNLINHQRTARWCPKSDGTIRIDNYISDDILKATSVVGNGTLSILCLLFIPTGATSLSVVNNRLCFLTYLNYEEHYILFSKRIASLFETGKHSDLIVKCGNQRFLVHKCILSARSPVFARGIRSLENSRRFAIDDVQPDILRIVLSYVYSGILGNYEFLDVYKIYAASVKFGMLILKYQCTKILEDNLQILNVFDTLFLAHTHKEVKLKLSAFKFIIYNRSEIRQQDKWEKIINEKDLYEEFREYVKTHIRNNPDEGMKLDDF